MIAWRETLIYDSFYFFGVLLICVRMDLLLIIPGVEFSFLSFEAFLLFLFCIDFCCCRKYFVHLREIFGKNHKRLHLIGVGHQSKRVAPLWSIYIVSEFLICNPMRSVNYIIKQFSVNYSNYKYTVTINSQESLNI